MAELKPCPFCGGEQVFFMPDEDEEQHSEDTTTGFIWCQGCGFSSDTFFKDVAFQKWNRRAGEEDQDG
jgi:Lar family restriction alleviation protein